MDVAPWDKHWIKRELDGFGLLAPPGALGGVTV